MLLKARPSIYLSLFRIGLGLMMFMHFYSLIERVNNYAAEDVLTFPYPGLDWINILSQEAMYCILIVGFIGTLMLTVGFKHFFGSLVAAGSYAYFFFADKFYYNNHYYLLILLCVLIAFTNADARFSIQKKKAQFVPSWQYLILQLMLCIVLFYGGIAKLNESWISGVIPSAVVEGALGKNNPLLEFILTWGGLFFDILIPLFLFYKRTTGLAILGLIGFNLANHFLFGDISLFPFLMIMGSLLFLERTEWNPFTRGMKPQNFIEPLRITKIILYSFFVFQLIFPLRHYFIPGNTDWTGQGHYFSWRMKSYTKEIKMEFFVHDQKSGALKYPLNIGLDEYSIQRAGAFPDMVSHLAKHLEKILVKSGEKNFEVRVNYWVELNNTKSRRAIDPTTNLAKADYRLWSNNAWILPYF